jgi:copper resistance protein C
MRRHAMRATLRTSALLGAMGVALFALTTPAVAHTRLVGTEPEDHATIIEEPAAVTLLFSEPVNQTLADVEVVAPDGTAVTDGPTRIDGPLVEQPLRPLLQAGTYIVAYRVLARDGHHLTGEFRFTYEGGVRSGETATLQEPPPAPPAPAEEGVNRRPEPDTLREERGALGPQTDPSATAPAPASGVPRETPWPLLVVTAAVLVAFVGAAVHAVRSLLRWEPETPST